MSSTRLQETVMRRFDLAGQTALVTGGNRGIGYALCHALAQAGADIVIILHLISTRLFPNLNTNPPLLPPLRKRLGEKVNSW